MSGRVEVDPVVLTCAVRYALGRSTYMPDLIAGEVRRCWPWLGGQRKAILRDVTEWVAAEWKYSTGTPTGPWVDLLDWIIEHIEQEEER